MRNHLEALGRMKRSLRAKMCEEPAPHDESGTRIETDGTDEESEGDAKYRKSAMRGTR